MTFINKIYQASDPTKYTHTKQVDLKSTVFESDNVLIENDIRGQYIAMDQLQTSSLKMVKSFHSNSSSSNIINANKRLFLESYLCKPVDQFGKAAVMSMSNGGTPPRFSKYSGVVEWRNAVYLWVNIGGKTGYHNTFSEGGRFIMWYGGSRMHAGECCVQNFFEMCLHYYSQTRR